MTDEAIEEGRYLKRVESYELWYARSSGRWTRALFLCRTASFVSTIGAALITALINKDQFDTFKIPIVVLATLGTASSTLLAEFRVHRMLNLREEGRTEAAHLVNYAHDKLRQFASDPAQYAKIRDEIRERLRTLEIQQGRGFADANSKETSDAHSAKPSQRSKSIETV